jgi:hypothetical protein
MACIWSALESRVFCSLTATVSMPVTRSFSHQPRPQPFPTANPPPSRTQSQNATTTEHLTDIVVALTSSDAESTVSKKKPLKKKKEKSRSRLQSSVVEIIEISSDDEALPARPKPTAVHATMPPPAPLPEPAAIAEFRRQISKYRGVRVCFVLHSSRMLTSPIGLLSRKPQSRRRTWRNFQKKLRS